MNRGEAVTQEGDVHLSRRETLNSWSQVKSRIKLRGNNENNSLDHCSSGPSVLPAIITTIMCTPTGTAEIQWKLESWYLKRKLGFLVCVEYIEEILLKWLLEKLQPPCLDPNSPTLSHICPLLWNLKQSLPFRGKQCWGKLKCSIAEGSHTRYLC